MWGRCFLSYWPCHILQPCLLTVSPSLQFPGSPNHSQVLIFPTMLHSSLSNRLPLIISPFLFLSLLSYPLDSSTVPSELCSVVCNFHCIFSFISEHCLYLPTLTKIPFSIEDSISPANKDGCLFLHTLDTLSLYFSLFPSLLAKYPCFFYIPAS